MPLDCLKFLLQTLIILHENFKSFKIRSQPIIFEKDDILGNDVQDFKTREFIFERDRQ